MYLTILIVEAECIVNGTRVAVNLDIPPQIKDSKLKLYEMILKFEFVYIYLLLLLQVSHLEVGE